MLIAVFAFTAEMVDRSLDFDKESLKKELCEDNDPENDDTDSEEESDEELFKTVDWIVEEMYTPVVVFEPYSLSSPNYVYHFSLENNPTKPPYCPPERV